MEFRLLRVQVKFANHTSTRSGYIDASMHESWELYVHTTPLKRNHTSAGQFCYRLEHKEPQAPDLSLQSTTLDILIP